MQFFISYYKYDSLVNEVIIDKMINSVKKCDRHIIICDTLLKESDESSAGKLFYSRILKYNIVRLLAKVY